MSKAMYMILATALVTLMGATGAHQQEAVPGGTQVNVHLLQPLSSATATVGEIFGVQVAEHVVVNHHVVIQKGASGTGRVVSVQKAYGKSPGEMTIEIAQVHAVDGSIVHLHTYMKHAERYEYGKAHTATVLGTIATGPLGLIFHNMVKGKDVTVSAEQVLPAYTSMTVAVDIP